MFEFRVNVAVNGWFLFSTDWDSDKARVTQTYKALCAKFGESGVLLMRRTKVTEHMKDSASIDAFLGE